MTLLAAIIATTLTIGNLTTEYKTQPLGIDLAWNPTPRFGWQYTSSDDGMQSSYQVVVYNGYEGTDVVWDSGVIISNQSQQIPYGGSTALRSDSDYSWTVTVNKQYSPVKRALFSTGPDAQEWARNGVWVGGGYNLLRTSVTIHTQNFSRSRAYVTGLGLYTLTINGKRFDHPLSPGWSTVPTERIQADAYDVQSALVVGPNNITMQLGMGKYGYISDYCVGFPKTFPPLNCYAALLQLSVDNVVVAETDPATWEGTTVSPITFDHLFLGETYDARVKPSGWKPCQRVYPNVTLVATWDTPILSHGNPVTAVAVPTSAAPGGQDAYVFDFGRNMAGYCTLTLPTKLTAGQTFTLLHAEILNASVPHANVQNTYGSSTQNRDCSPTQFNCADQIDIYIAAGDGTDAATWTPSFTFHGFRYVQLYGWPGGSPPPQSAVICHHLYSDIGEGSGGVHFPNFPVLNAVQDAIVRTQKANMLSHPSDCPTREKRGWMGDAQVTVHQAMYNLNAAPLYENWIRVFQETISIGCTEPPTSRQYACCGNVSSFGCQPGLTPLDAQGSLPDVVPYEQKPLGAWPGDWSWEAAGEVIPHALWRMTGDTVFLRKIYPYIQQHMAFAIRAIEPSSLLSFGYYGDWVAPDGISAGLAVNCYLYESFRMAAELADAVGKNSDAAMYRDQAKAVRLAVRAKFFDNKTGLWEGTQNMNSQATAIALGLGLATEGNVSAAMVADYERQRGNPTCGLVSCRWILQGFVAINRTDLALAMATKTTSPSWGYMTLPEMPGTIWENWAGDAYNSDGSKNHPMFTGGIGTFLYEHAVGLRIQRGSREVQIVLDETSVRTLQAASSWHDTLYGRVEVSWTLHGDEPSSSFALSLTVPCGAMATVDMPSSLPHLRDSSLGHIWETVLDRRVNRIKGCGVFLFTSH